MIDLAVGGALCLFLLCASLVDLQTRRIPNLISISLIGLGLLLAFLDGGFAKIFGHSLSGALIGFGAFWLVSRFYLVARNRPALGLGDAKLLAAAGAWLGPFALAPLVLIASVVGLGYVGIRWIIEGRQAVSQVIPFGPFLSLAFFSIWCLSTYGGYKF